MWKTRSRNPTHVDGFQRGESFLKQFISEPDDQVNIVTSFRYTQSWPTVIRLTSEGVFGDVTKLITHVLPIEKAVEAMEITADRSKLAIKVQIVD
jgi:threonine dehydrogenase-like Zn-dependent dehydrogenase